MSTQKKRKVVPTEAGDQTKKKILSAAEKLFAESGYAPLVMLDNDCMAPAQMPNALPKFESIHFTSNKGMTTVIRELFDGKADKASLNRPDFVIRGDGSTGFYSLPYYNEDHQEEGVGHLVIVDLKTTKLSLGSKEKEQIWKYVKELKKKGYIQSETRVDGFILGDQIESGEGGTRTEDNDRVKIQPLLYSIILSRAEQRLMKLYSKVKEAPFLVAQQEELSKFIEPIAVHQPDLLGAEPVVAK